MNLNVNFAYTGKYLIRYTTSTGELYSSNLGSVGNEQSTSLLPTFAEITSGDGFIEFEIVLNRATPSFLTVYPVFELTVDDYVKMIVRDSVAISFQKGSGLNMGTAVGTFR